MHFDMYLFWFPDDVCWRFFFTCKLVLINQTERSTIPACPSFIAILHKGNGNTESSIFRCVKQQHNYVCFCTCNWTLNAFFNATCVGFQFVKSPEVTLCGWRGCKPSINKLINKSSRWTKHVSSRLVPLTLSQRNISGSVPHTCSRFPALWVSSVRTSILPTAR